MCLPKGGSLDQSFLYKSEARVSSNENQAPREEILDDLEWRVESTEPLERGSWAACGKLEQRFDFVVAEASHNLPEYLHSWIVVGPVRIVGVLLQILNVNKRVLAGEQLLELSHIEEFEIAQVHEHRESIAEGSNVGPCLQIEAVIYHSVDVSHAVFSCHSHCPTIGHKLSFNIGSGDIVHDSEGQIQVGKVTLIVLDEKQVAMQLCIKRCQFIHQWSL